MSAENEESNDSNEELSEKEDENFDNEEHSEDVCHQNASFTFLTKKLIVKLISVISDKQCKH